MYTFNGTTNQWDELTNPTIGSGPELDTMPTIGEFFRPAEHTFGSIAISGATGSGVSVAISFALNIASVETVAMIKPTAVVTITDDAVAGSVESVPCRTGT